MVSAAALKAVGMHKRPAPLCPGVIAGSVVREIDISRSQRRILQQEGGPARSES
jgi:hypothetical protein